MTSPRLPSSWSPSPPERRSSDHSSCPYPHPGTSLAMGAGPLQTLTHPNRATGTSALSAAILLWHPGALVPTPSTPKDENVRWQELLSPTFHAHHPVHKHPYPTDVQEPQGILLGPSPCLPGHPQQRVGQGHSTWGSSAYCTLSP